MRTDLLRLLIGAGLMLVSLPAAAQTPDAATIATRRALLDEAQGARDHGDHGHALQSALAAARIEMTPSVALFIAEEQQTLTQSANAYQSAQRCSTLAENNASIPNRAAILARCRELTDSLRPRIALVTLRFANPPGNDVQVTVDQQPITQPGSAPVAVEPGPLVVEASSGGQVRFHRDGHASAGDSIAIDVDLAPAAASTASAAPGSTSNTSTGSSGPGVGPYIVAAVGAAALIAAIPFYLVRQNALNQCTPDPMPSTVDCTQSQADTANTFNTLTNIAWIGGTVVLAGGVAWWVVARITSHGPSHEHARRTLLPTAFVLPGGGAMVGIGGAL